MQVGKQLTLQKRHMCFTISEAYKLFYDNNPAVKFSHTSFYNQKPDFIQLWAETPINTCLCTYHENMWLLTSAELKTCQISVDWLIELFVIKTIKVVRHKNVKSVKIYLFGMNLQNKFSMRMM